ncbi:MAG: DUF3990 domain-containing protein [Firmicutes bacterium]|nr:DUF3990 domain-containing protein [Bacillota bacterium]
MIIYHGSTVPVEIPKILPSERMLDFGEGFYTTRLEEDQVKKNKFAAILPVVIGGLAIKIIEETQVSEDEAFDKLYNSELYAALENEATKVWTYSVPKLFELYQNEMITGRLELPEY